MATFFQYDEMTWDAVEKLPRSTTLVLPLGSGYDMDLLASQLNHPSQIGLLPSFPFGWRGSGLEVPELVFFQYISNLLDSLRDDGFSRVYCLMPQGLNPQSFYTLHPASFITLPHTTQKRNSPLLPPDSERGKVILIPIGHTEQHGYHLPLSVDTVIIDAIAKGVVAKMPTRTTALPVMPYGASTHRSSFAATMNVGGRAFEDFWLAVVNILVQRGFNRFYFISGHGGNSSFLVNIVKYAGERHRRIFCATAWLHTSGSIGAEALKKYRTSPIGGMGHAGELETSYMLHLRLSMKPTSLPLQIIIWTGSREAHWSRIHPGMMIQLPDRMEPVVTGQQKKVGYGLKLQSRRKPITLSKSMNNTNGVKKDATMDTVCGEKSKCKRGKVQLWR